MKPIMKNLVRILRLKPWLSVVTLVYVAGMIAVSIPKSMDQTEDSDHWIVWQAGKDFSEGEDLYYRDTIRPYISPPFSAFLYQPFHLMPLKISNLVLFLLNALVLLPLAIYLIYKMLLLIKVDARKAEISLILATVFTLKY